MSPRCREDVEPRVVRTFEDAAALLSPEPRVALDLETGGLSPWKTPIHVITLYGAESDTVAVLHYPRGQMVPGRVLRWLEERPEIVMHNGVQFDALFLGSAGMSWEKPRIYDSLVAEKATLGVERWDVRVSLASTIARHLGRQIDKNADHGRWGDLVLDEAQLAYVKSDIRWLLDVQDAQLAKADSNKTRGCVEFEMGLAKPVIQMSMNGMPVDLGALQAYFDSRADRHEEVDRYLQEELGPINLQSSVQLKKALGVRFDPGMFPNTKAERLIEFSRLSGDVGKICSSILEWRSVRQRRNMLGEEWQSNIVDHGGVFKIHGRFWQIGTHTGRFTSTSPNLQQIPRDMRGVFGGVPGWSMGKSDYAAIEVRVAAALSGDEEMIAAFNAGEDIHTLVASVAFQKPPEAITPEERKVAKAMSFTLLFGGGVPMFRSYVRIHGGVDLSMEVAQSAVDNFYARFQGINRMRLVAENQARTSRAVVIAYPTGLRRVVTGYDLKASVLLNNTVQGTAASGIKKALLECEKAGIMEYVVAPVHDEIVFFAPTKIIEEVRRTVDECMIRGMRWALEGAPDIAIGVESTHGPSWSGLPENFKVTEA